MDEVTESGQAVEAPTFDRTGQLVRYVLAEGHNRGEVRPAFIVRDWNPHSDLPGAVNLQVFTDDGNDGLPGVMWVCSVMFDATGQEPGTWHDPPR
jgi:hypothetical protein